MAKLHSLSVPVPQSLTLCCFCTFFSLLRTQVEKWEAQRSAGTYPGPVPGETKGGH